MKKNKIPFYKNWEFWTPAVLTSAYAAGGIPYADKVLGFSLAAVVSIIALGLLVIFIKL